MAKKENKNKKKNKEKNSLKEEGIKLRDSLAVIHRPPTLDNVIGNERNINIIKGFFKSRKIPKTWLLSGLTGAGKTTVARIIAMTINCQDLKGINPCLKCSSCKAALNGFHTDIYEINAGGDDGKIEGIKSKINNLNLSARYNFRVLIVDEAHLLTGKSKETVLKPMEEPPPGTVWILCTTEPEKLPTAGLGRCQKLYFSYPSPKEIKKRLIEIAKKEYNKDIVSAMEPYLVKIGEAVNGQPRDAITLMEQVAAYLGSFDNIGKITDKEIKNSIQTILTTAGNVDVLAIRTLTHLYTNKKLKPFEVLSELEPSKVQEFIGRCFQYSYYAYLWALNNKIGKSVNKKGFYINFIRWEKALKTINFGTDIKAQRALAMCNSATEALEKMRFGSMPTTNCMVWMISDYLEKNINNKIK